MRDHLHRPGPLYWDFKCLRCDGAWYEHPGLLRFLWRRLRNFYDKDKR